MHIIGKLLLIFDLVIFQNNQSPYDVIVYIHNKLFALEGEKKVEQLLQVKLSVVIYIVE